MKPKNKHKQKNSGFINERKKIKHLHSNRNSFTHLGLIVQVFLAEKHATLLILQNTPSSDALYEMSLLVQEKLVLSRHQWHLKKQKLTTMILKCLKCYTNSLLTQLPKWERYIIIKKSFNVSLYDALKCTHSGEKWCYRCQQNGRSKSLHVDRSGI